MQHVECVNTYQCYYIMKTHYNSAIIPLNFPEVSKPTFYLRLNFILNLHTCAEFWFQSCRIFFVCKIKAKKDTKLLNQFKSVAKVKCWEFNCKFKAKHRHLHKYLSSSSFFVIFSSKNNKNTINYSSQKNQF